MKTNNTEIYKIRLIRVAAWGQAIGFLAMNTFVLVEDAPNYLQRVDLLSLLVVFSVAAALSVPRVATFIAGNLSSISISLFVLAISFATLVIAVVAVSLALSIPEVLVTEGWKYTRTTSLITMAIFLVAFIANIVLSIRLRRASLSQQAKATQS